MRGVKLFLGLHDAARGRFQVLRDDGDVVIRIIRVLQYVAALVVARFHFHFHIAVHVNGAVCVKHGIVNDLLCLVAVELNDVLELDVAVIAANFHGVLVLHDLQVRVDREQPCHEEHVDKLFPKAEVHFAGGRNVFYALRQMRQHLFVAAHGGGNEGQVVVILRGIEVAQQVHQGGRDAVLRQVADVHQHIFLAVMRHSALLHAVLLVEDHAGTQLCGGVGTIVRAIFLEESRVVILLRRAQLAEELVHGFRVRERQARKRTVQAAVCKILLLVVGEEHAFFARDGKVVEHAGVIRDEHIGGV